MTIPKREAIDEFLDANIADAWLIAFAKNKNISLITYEKSEPNSKKRIKIPDVCIEFNIHYLNTIEMFRKLGQSF